MSKTNIATITPEQINLLITKSMDGLVEGLNEIDMAGSSCSSIGSYNLYRDIENAIKTTCNEHAGIGVTTWKAMQERISKQVSSFS